MLHDQAFARAMIAGRSDTVAQAALSDAERGWLQAADPRAFAVDTYRTSRLLKALIDEFPCSVARVASLSGSSWRQGLHDFFSSTGFHVGIQRRGRLVESFAAWLAERDDQVLSALVALELSVALLARQRSSAGPGTSVKLAAGVGVLALPGGLLSLVHAVRAQLGDDVIGALDGYRWPPHQVRMAEQERVLVVAGAVEPLGGPLFDLLSCCGAPGGATLQQLIEVGARHEATAEDVAEIVDELRQDGVLR